MNSIANEVIKEIGRLKKQRYIVCIDGRCGSGKTSLSELLKNKLNAGVVHIDHYYLPFSDRKENWKELIGGNMDFKRLYDEVIEPYLNHKQIFTKGYAPRSDEYFETEKIDIDRPLIIEGSYSSYFDCYDYKIFLSCNSEIQKKRLIKREGDNYVNFENLWIRKEEDFFRFYDSEKRADTTIDTSGLF